MPPTRIKVYGFLTLTRRRYLQQAAIGGVILLLLLYTWWLGWSGLRLSFEGRELPPWMNLTIRILDHVPWILLGAGIYKVAEMWLVLRAFARREKTAAAGEAKQPTTPSSSD